MSTKTGPEKLREMMAADQPIVTIGAHNGMSARLGAEAGFDGIWASGFEISASYGIPDANILTMAENLHAAKMMNAVVDIPIVADCDNGYGNAINVIRCAQEYEKAGIAAICIEDNVFPKRCSFYAGVKRELASVEEHAGKIRAAKDAQTTQDFVVIARTEALIAGWGMDEALMRGRAYADAGADFVLVHSKSKSADEVLGFAKRWDRDTPLVCVPTIYSETKVETLYEAGYKLIIFANHGLRTSVKAMQETFSVLKKEMFTGSVDDRVVPLTRIYELIGVDQMKSDEKAFMPAQSEGVTAVVLAAGASQGLMPLVEEKPKAMLDVKGKTILGRQVETLNACGVKNIAVVRGYKKEAVNLPNLRYYDNDAYDSSNEIVSMIAAEKEMSGAFLLLYGDILFEAGHLQKLLKSSADVTILVDRAWNEDSRPRDGRGAPDLVVLEGAPEAGYRFVGAEHPHKVERISHKMDANEAHGEFVGMALFSPAATKAVRKLLNTLDAEHEGALHEAASLREATFTDLLQVLIDQGHDVQAIDVYKGWLEVDTFDDYKRAWSIIH
jgi:phosphoenolpyruvate phosphomutase